MNLVKAKKILYQAYNIANNGTITPSNDLSKFIDDIIDNTHLTFKYILFTAILAKATDDSINPLCLQAKSLLNGAYDARSLCHKIIVPFECTILNKAMGGSNEPFLNKPARFPEISLANSVRRGNDKDLLEKLYYNLPKINNSKCAFELLIYLLKKLIIIGNERKNICFNVSTSVNNEKIKLLKFFEKLLSKSCEGETLTLVVAALYKCIYYNNVYRIETHPVNECGASSKEVSDLDIYKDEVLFLSNEIKDKEYTTNDIKHAVEKVRKNNGVSLLFIEGMNGVYIDSEEDMLINEYKTKYNFLLSIINIKQLLPIILMNVDVVDINSILKYITDLLLNQKYKQITMQHFKETVSLVFNPS